MTQRYIKSLNFEVTIYFGKTKISIFKLCHTISLDENLKVITCIKNITQIQENKMQKPHQRVALIFPPDINDEHEN